MAMTSGEGERSGAGGSGSGSGSGSGATTTGSGSGATTTGSGFGGAGLDLGLGGAGSGHGNGFSDGFFFILEYLVAQKSEEGEHPGHNDRDDREPSGVLYPRQRRSGDGGADYGFPQLRLLRILAGRRAWACATAGWGCAGESG